MADDPRRVKEADAGPLFLGEGARSAWNGEGERLEQTLDALGFGPELVRETAAGEPEDDDG